MHFERNGFNANSSNNNNNITSILISAPLQRLTTFHIKCQVDYYNCLGSAADFVGRPNVLRALNNDYSPHKWTELEVPLPVFSLCSVVFPRGSQRRLAKIVELFVQEWPRVCVWVYRFVHPALRRRPSKWAFVKHNCYFTQLCPLIKINIDLNMYWFLLSLYYPAFVNVGLPTAWLDEENNNKSLFTNIKGCNNFKMKSCFNLQTKY